MTAAQSNPADGVGSPGTVLILAPAPADPAACPVWLTDPAADTEDPLVVSGAGSGARTGDRGHAVPPSATSARRPGTTRVDVAREGVIAPDGVTLLDRLKEAADGNEDNGKPVCVDGLTRLVRERGTEVAFRVLVALQTVTHHRPMRVHVHLDPDPVDVRTRRTLAQPVDAVVRYDGDDLVFVRDERA